MREGTDPNWRSKIPQIRRAKLDWILANIDVSQYNPFNPRDCDDVAMKMLKAGAIRKSTNSGMVSKSIESLLVEAQKIKGLRRR